MGLLATRLLLKGEGGLNGVLQKTITSAGTVAIRPTRAQFPALHPKYISIWHAIPNNQPMYFSNEAIEEHVNGV